MVTELLRNQDDIFYSSEDDISYRHVYSSQDSGIGGSPTEFKKCKNLKSKGGDLEIFDMEL